jgi:hypothetical protein
MKSIRDHINLIENASSSVLTESEAYQVHEWLNEYYIGDITKQEFLNKIDEAKLSRDQVTEIAWAPFTALAGGAIGAAAVAADKGLNPLKWSKGDWASIGTDAAIGATGVGLGAVAGRALAKTAIKKGATVLGKKLAADKAKKAAAKAALTNTQIGGKAVKTAATTAAASPAIDSSINIAGRAVDKL